MQLHGDQEVVFGDLGVHWPSSSSSSGRRSQLGPGAEDDYRTEVAFGEAHGYGRGPKRPVDHVGVVKG